MSWAGTVMPLGRHMTAYTSGFTVVRAPDDSHSRSLGGSSSALTAVFNARSISNQPWKAVLARCSQIFVTRLRHRRPWRDSADSIQSRARSSAEQPFEVHQAPGLQILCPSNSRAMHICPVADTSLKHGTRARGRSMVANGGGKDNPSDTIGGEEFGLLFPPDPHYAHLAIGWLSIGVSRSTCRISSSGITRPPGLITPMATPSTGRGARSIGRLRSSSRYYRPMRDAASRHRGAYSHCTTRRCMSIIEGMTSPPDTKCSFTECV